MIRPPGMDGRRKWHPARATPRRSPKREASRGAKSGNQYRDHRCDTGEASDPTSSLRAPLMSSGALTFQAQSKNRATAAGYRLRKLLRDTCQPDAVRGSIKFADKRLRRAPRTGLTACAAQAKIVRPGAPLGAQEWRSLPDWKGLKRGTRTAKESHGGCWPDFHLETPEPGSG